jgi:DNA repair exonuclease SbcCD nuclease subunit
MMKFIWRTDIHIADESPMTRLDDWLSTILDKIRQVGQIAKRHDATAVIDGGDYFHIKSPSRNSHRLIQETIRAHQDYPCPVIGNVGNHDVKYGEIRFLDESPLGVLFETGIFKRNYDKYEHVFVQDNLKVRVVGVPYHGISYNKDYIRSLCTKKDEDFLLVHMHLLASLEGGSMFEGEDILSYDEIMSYDADVFMFGHWHKDQGVYTRGDKTIINIGSLSRGSISLDDLQRIPSVACINLSKGSLPKIEVIPLHVQPAENIFDLASKKHEFKKEMDTVAFIDSLKTRLSLTQGRTLMDDIRDAVLEDKVKERVLSYLELSKD